MYMTMSCVVIFQVSLLVSVAIKRFCGDVPMPQLSDINKQDVSVFFTDFYFQLPRIILRYE